MKMTRRFDIVIPKMVEQKDLADFFKKVYAEYGGDLFSSPTIRLIVDNIRGQVQLKTKTQDFSELSKYGSKIGLLFLDTEKGPGLRIFYPTSAYGHPTISFVPGLIYAETKSEVSESIKKLNDVLGFAKLLMKHSGASYFYGGYEVLGEITDKDTADVRLIYCRDNKYIEMLQAHLQNLFGKFFDKDEIKRIVNETTRIEREGDFTIIYFFDITAGGLTDNRFYQTIKKLIKK